GGGAVDERADAGRGLGGAVLPAGPADRDDLGGAVEPGLPVEEQPRAAPGVREAEDPRHLGGGAITGAGAGPAAGEEPARRRAHGVLPAATATAPTAAGSLVNPDGPASRKVWVSLLAGLPGRRCSSPRSGSITTAATVFSRRMSPVPATQTGGWASSA